MDRSERGFIERYGMDKVVREAFDATDADTYQMLTGTDILLIDSTLGAGTVYLPPVATMIGRVICVQVEAFGTGNSVVVKPYEHYASKPDSVMWGGLNADTAALTSFTLASDEAYVVLYSNGRTWIALAYELNTAA